MKESHYTVYIDGTCILCNKALRFIVKYERGDRFRFASLTSDYAKEVLPASLLLAGNKSLIVQAGSSFYTRADAVTFIMERLRYFRWMVPFFKLLPTRFKNRVYDYIARNRHQWLGYAKCSLEQNKNIPESKLAAPDAGT